MCDERVREKMDMDGGRVLEKRGVGDAVGVLVTPFPQRDGPPICE